MGERFKALLTRIGAHCSRRAIHRLNAAVNYLEVGRWLREFGADTSRRFDDRQELYEFIAGRIGDRRVLYLEFGVYRGETIRAWSRLLTHPDSKLHGFDSFEGLPADFNLTTRRGAFATSGEPPRVDDFRVGFSKGWFEDTLPRFEIEPGKLLVVHMDADLYASTIFVLRELKDALVPGSYLLFDEFSDRQHELRAFEEFLQESGFRFEFAGGDRALARVAFVRTG